MENQRKAVLFGSSGLIGNNLCRKLKQEGYLVIAAGRDTERMRQRSPFADHYEQITGDLESFEKIIRGSEAVFNFSGAPVFIKWKGDYRNEIYDSRVKLTSMIARSIVNLDVPPRVFVNGTASGIYGYDSFDDRDITEDEKPASDFWGSLVRDWEASADMAQSEKTRVVNLRTSVVLDSKEGALPQLVKVFRRGLGGPIKPGTQWFPWIHIEDEVDLALFCSNNEKITGAVNASAPNVPRMNEFAETLGRVLDKPSRIKVPKTIIRMMFGEVSELLTNGKKVIPSKAEKNGFQFRFPVLYDALKDLTSAKN